MKADGYDVRNKRWPKRTMVGGMILIGANDNPGSYLSGMTKTKKSPRYVTTL
jgi:hypothetical protein